VDYSQHLDLILLEPVLSQQNQQLVPKVSLALSTVEKNLIAGKPQETSSKECD
jgi:hypothetical protein